MTHSGSASPATESSRWAGLALHPDATLVVDRTGRVVEVNQAAETLFNLARSAIIGAQAKAVLGAADGDDAGRLLADSGTTVSGYGIELRVGNGGIFSADIKVSRLQDDDDLRIVSIHPEPRGGKIALRRPGVAARSAAAAAAMLAHEIKNPLSGIRGAAQLLGKTGGSESRALSDLICGEVDRIATLIDGMQDFTRDAPLHCVPLNIYPAIAQAHDIAFQGFGSTVRFIEEFDPSLPDAVANHDALVQILLNLIKNACEAMAGMPAATIRLTTAYRHGWALTRGIVPAHAQLPIEIAVSDCGPGITPNIADMMFDPFVTSKAEGQGLGLALVDKLVRDMGGIIEYDRNGGWTTFRLHLAAAVSNGKSA
ncbi:MAG: ATP-binding protein [Sphingopyxis sp.]|nr:ATP-binding protein [Sphingopyxis sp.]